MDYREVELICTEDNDIILESADDSETWLNLSGQNEHDPPPGQPIMCWVVPKQERLVSLDRVLEMVKEQVDFFREYPGLGNGYYGADRVLRRLRGEFGPEEAADE